MIVQIKRLGIAGNATLGVVYIAKGGMFTRAEIDLPVCFTLEDLPRSGAKVPGETRIPAGMYEAALRTEGGMHDRYSQRFGTFHAGMLWLKDVPGFEWIYIHVGNNDKDTAGCILVGDTALIRGELGMSVDAYRRVYNRAANELAQGRRVRIEVVDEFE